MPRRTEKDPEFSHRLDRVRERLAPAIHLRFVTGYAEWLGVDRNTYRSWERCALPAAILLARAFLGARHPVDGRPIAEAPRLVCWLATGEPYLEPAWLRDKNADPFEETSPVADVPPRGPGGGSSNVIALSDVRERIAPLVPFAREVAAREAQNLATGTETANFALLETAVAFEKWVRSLENAPAQPASPPGGVAGASGSNLLQLHDDRIAV